jgi:hypothetical protein
VNLNPFRRKVATEGNLSGRFGPHAATSSLQRRAKDREPKRGMWVRWGDRVGILTNLEPGDIATVMCVDSHGDNALEIHCTASELRQAYYNEIPRNRISHLSEEVLTSLGYI